MNKYLSLFVFVLAFINHIGQEMNYKIIPTPQKMIIEKNVSFSFDDETIIKVNDFENSLFSKASKYLITSLNKIFEFQIEIKSVESPNNFILLSFIDDSQIPEIVPYQQREEFYKLTIESSKVRIEAATEKGLFYGCTSLIQLVENTKDNKIPGCKIEDWPDMKFRGISDDISRGQVSTLDNFKRIIKFISRYKMNTYMPYLEDMIQFDSYPSIGKDRGALSKKEIKELLTYADDHFVELIPIFQTLGHFENILSQKEFIEYADWPGAASLDVTNEETYQFINTLLEEIFELFPSKYFHMGADESYDVGFGNSRKLSDSIGLASVHAQHYQRVYEICKNNNKEVMMYGDIILAHPEILEKIPKDIIIVDWHYLPKFDYPSTKIFNEAGFKYIVSPTVWNFNSSFPENYLAIPNIETLTKSGHENNSIGMLNSSWGDYGAETFRELNLYGYAWSAQCSWNFENSNIADFNNSFFLDFYGSNDENILNIYNELNDVNNQVVWNSFWRHPLLDFRKPDWREYNFPIPSKLHSMTKYSTSDVSNIKITRNSEHFELIELAQKFKNYFAKKLNTQKEIHSIFYNKNTTTKEVINLIEENILILQQLKTDYRKFWLRTNKEANLWMIEEKFDRLITYFLETKLKIQNHEFSSPIIKSKCIYYPSTNDDPIVNATFIKTINIDGKLESAYLQFLADGNAKLFINDKYIDEVYVKRSGSLWLEQQRVKLIDVKDFLIRGENEIKITVKNHKNRSACCNVIGKFITENNTIMLFSDKNWKTYNNVNDAWINVSVQEHEKIEIIEPNFDILRKSWIER